MTLLTRKRIALVGAGGVGKSSLLKFFAADGFTVFPSISREFYALMRIKDETAYMALSTSEKANFQRKMRLFYMQRYKEFLDKNSNVSTITDRSLFDHFAFNIYGLEGQLSLKILNRLIDTNLEYINDFYTHLIYLPYPQPWMDTVDISDGFRNVDVSKNYSVAAIMFYPIVFHKLVSQRLKPELTIVKQADQTPEEIYQQIREAVV